MMYFTQSLTSYSPKNRAWKKLVDWIQSYEHVLIKDEVSLDALRMEIEAKVKEINAEHPKLKEILFSYDPRINSFTARVISVGCPDEVFILNYCRVKSYYQFSESNSPEIIAECALQEGGE